MLVSRETCRNSEYVEMTFLLVVLDVNECAENTHTCDRNANCIKFDNTVSYSCQCKQSFVGDGFNCTEGKNVFSLSNTISRFRRGKFAISFH